MLEIIIGVIGVILTLGFSIYSIKRMKKSAPKVELTFAKDECFSIIDESYNDLGLDIKYKGEKITNSIILLKATLRNSGTQDVDKNLIFQPLKIITTENYKWLEAKVKSSPENSNIDVSINATNELILNWDLLKENESLGFEMVIEEVHKTENEFPSTINFYDNLKFEHRITNLKNIIKDSYNTTLKKRSMKIFITWLFVGLLYLAVGVSAIFIPNIKGLQDIIYSVQYQNTVINVKINPQLDNLLKLENIDKNEKIELGVDKFNKDYKIQSVELQKDERRSLFMRILGIVTLIASFFLFRRSYNYLIKYIKAKNGTQQKKN